MWTEMGRVPECGGEFKRSEAKKEIKDHKQKKKNNSEAEWGTRQAVIRCAKVGERGICQTC